MILSEELALNLLQINAIRLNLQNPFTWASGLRSPVYCDNRLALSHPEVRNKIIDGFLEMAREFALFDVVAGVATAGIAYGALVADRLKLPFVYVRSSAKTHGRKNLIEGRLPGNAKTLVIEDLISTGGSSLAAVEALRAEQSTVKAVLAIFQYNLVDAVKQFSEAQCIFKTLTDFKTLIGVAEQTGQIQHSDIASLTAWHDDPHAWSDAIVPDHK